MAAESHILSTIDKWMDMKEKLEEYTKKTEKYRAVIERYMVDNGVSTIPFTRPDEDEIERKMEVVLSSTSRETLAKRDVPPEIWEQFCKSTRFRTLRVRTQKKVKK